MVPKAEQRTASALMNSRSLAQARQMVEAAWLAIGSPRGAA